MKKRAWLWIAISGLVLTLNLPAGHAGPSADAKTWSVTVQAQAPLAGGVDKARQQAIKTAKLAALKKYFEARLPAGLREERAGDLQKLLANVDAYVISWEILSESQKQGQLLLQLEVVLNREKLESALKAQGVIPSRPLPQLLITASCNPGSGEIPTSWRKNPGAVNPCEAAMKTIMEKYGFPVLAPTTANLSADPIAVLDMGDEAQKLAFYQELASRLSAGAMIAARITLGPAPASAPIPVSFSVMVIDLERRITLWNNRKDNLQAKAGTNRNSLLLGLCFDQAERAATELYRGLSFSPTLQPGQTLTLTMIGFNSYVLVKEFERRLKTDGPGVTYLAPSRISPGLIEYTVRASVDARGLAEWIVKNQPAGLSYQVLAVDDSQARIQVGK